MRARITRTPASARAPRASLCSPRLSTLNPQPSTNDPAVILFTSGSEGDPKGVELTHRNLLANIRQMLSVIDLMETDRFFNALPLFHSFGLTVGLLLPLVRGVFVLLYPSPLHYRVVPSAFYNLDCTVFFGTNTFLNGYARKAHPYDFRTLRYLFAGAEKVQEATAALWMRKFGVRILEGYGATECSPCLSANLPMRPRHGSAGQFLPGIEYGSNRSKASPRAGGCSCADPMSCAATSTRKPTRSSRPSAAGTTPATSSSVDADGFVFILGRLKRFAKVSGEMVSLAAVEDALGRRLPAIRLAVRRGGRRPAGCGPGRKADCGHQRAEADAGGSPGRHPRPRPEQPGGSARDQGHARLAAARHRQDQPPRTGEACVGAGLSLAGAGPNPNTEIRNPKEVQNPKSEVGRAAMPLFRIHQGCGVHACGCGPDWGAAAGFCDCCEFRLARRQAF